VEVKSGGFWWQVFWRAPFICPMLLAMEATGAKVVQEAIQTSFLVSDGSVSARAS
jgi:hypothetical protein